MGVTIRFAGDDRGIRLLLNAGAFISGTGALHIAAFMGQIPIMRLLLQHNTDADEIPHFPIDAIVGFWRKGTPVHWAIAGGRRDAIKLLLQKNPNLRILDQNEILVRERIEQFDPKFISEGLKPSNQERYDIEATKRRGTTAMS